MRYVIEDDEINEKDISHRNKKPAELIEKFDPVNDPFDTRILFELAKRRVEEDDYAEDTSFEEDEDDPTQIGHNQKRKEQKKSLKKLHNIVLIEDNDEEGDENGYMMRRKKNTDLQKMSKELRMLFKDCAVKKDPTKPAQPFEIVSRSTPFTEPIWKRTEQKPGHNQEESRIAMLFEMKTLSQEIVRLFYGQTERNKEDDVGKYYGFDLLKNQFVSKRANFEQFFSVNYKKYFYCIDRQKNPLMEISARMKIEALINKHAGEDAPFVSVG